MIPAAVTVACSTALVVMGAYRVSVPEAWFGTIGVLVLAIFIGATSKDRPSDLE